MLTDPLIDQHADLLTEFGQQHSSLRDLCLWLDHNCIKVVSNMHVVHQPYLYSLWKSRRASLTVNGKWETSNISNTCYTSTNGDNKENNSLGWEGTTTNTEVRLQTADTTYKVWRNKPHYPFEILEPYTYLHRKEWGRIGYPSPLSSISCRIPDNMHIVQFSSFHGKIQYNYMSWPLCFTLPFSLMSTTG